VSLTNNNPFLVPEFLKYINTLLIGESLILNCVGRTGNYIKIIMNLNLNNINNLELATSSRRRQDLKSIKLVGEQKLNRAPILPATWVAWFIGLLDGDGYLGHTKSGNYIKWELSLKLSSRDLSLLSHIQNTLGIGVVKPVSTAKLLPMFGL